MRQVVQWCVQMIIETEARKVRLYSRKTEIAKLKTQVIFAQRAYTVTRKKETGTWEKIQVARKAWYDALAELRKAEYQYYMFLSMEITQV